MDNLSTLFSCHLIRNTDLLKIINVLRWKFPITGNGADHVNMVTDACWEFLSGSDFILCTFETPNILDSPQFGEVKQTSYLFLFINSFKEYLKILTKMSDSIHQ